jgi:hypothetical protein
MIVWYWGFEMKVTYTGNIADPPEGGYRVGHFLYLMVEHG